MKDIIIVYIVIIDKIMQDNIIIDIIIYIHINSRYNNKRLFINLNGKGICDVVSSRYTIIESIRFVNFPSSK